MKKKFTFLLVFIVVAMAAWLAACGGGGPAPGSDAEKRTIVYSTDRPHPTTDCVYDEGSFRLTPGGVTLRSCVDVPLDAQQAIDRGVAHQIRNSSHYNPGWTAVRTLPEYQFFFVPPTAHNQVNDPGSPALMVRYLTMSSTVGVIQSAGTCLGVDGTMFIPGKGPVQDPRYASPILPEQSVERWQYLNYLEESARNESEHIAEWFNNRDMFKTFAIVGDIHPHFEDWPEAPALAVPNAPWLVAPQPKPCEMISGVMVCRPAGALLN
jgi:hypothetical protein